MDWLARDLSVLAEERSAAYRDAEPFPHIVIDGLFRPEALRAVAADLPDLAGIPCHDFANKKQIKRTSLGEDGLGPAARAFIHFLNSGPFVAFLEALTDVEEALVPDPGLEGGGYHEIAPGGLLKIHADFRKHPRTGLDRRLNALVYLNEDWDEDWGGHFELWDHAMERCIRRLCPQFNRLVIFSTRADAFHGHPEPLACPPERRRRSVALYYYSNGRPAREIADGYEEATTLFRDRPGSEDRVYSWSQYLKKHWLPPALRRSKKRRSRR